jgi:hypothetical protein
LKDILSKDPDLSAAEKKNIREKIRTLVNYMTYYQITDTLLKQFRTIAPDLFSEMDTLKDSRGRIMDIYVKFTPKNESPVQAAGVASFQHAGNDPNTCTSEYGEGTVSIKIWIVNKALWVLSHEFGHLKYVVPHLASYVKFYKKKYNRSTDPELGHRPDDPSGRMALTFEHRFGQSYSRYLKSDFDTMMSPMVLINPIRKNIVQTLSLY